MIDIDATYDDKILIALYKSSWAIDTQRFMLMKDSGIIYKEYHHEEVKATDEERRKILNLLESDIKEKEELFRLLQNK